METAFKRRYAQLNSAQKRAVDTIEGPVMVIAGPGTGKTEVLTMRIANILGRGTEKGDDKKAAVRPEQILALTFTEAGAVNMRRRLAQLIGQRAYRVMIGTFHSFANSIIRDYPDYFPDIIGAAAITEIDQVRILRDLLDRESLKELRPFGDRYYYLAKILAAINELKRQGVSPEGLDAFNVRERAAFDTIDDLIWEKGAHAGKMKGKYADRLKYIERNVELATIYTAYQRALRKAKQYDFSDMIMETAAALQEHHELLEALQDRFRYFLVDEHQDTNDAQNRIIELLADASPRPNLFVVGDEKQAIFRFQGASLENFLYFQKKFPEVLLIPLTANYRSRQAILDAAEAISPRENRLQAEMEAEAIQKKTGTNTKAAAEYPAQIAELSSPDVEYRFIAENIKKILKTGVAPAEIAVLYRDNRDVGPLVRVLEKEAIPFAIESDQDVLDDADIKKMLKILRVVEAMGKQGSWQVDDVLFDGMHVDFFHIAPIDIYTVSVYAKRHGKRIYEVIGSEALLDAAGITPAAKMKFLTLYNSLANWLRYVKNRPAVEAFEAIVRESGFLTALLASAGAMEKIAKLHALFDLLKSLVERNRNYALSDFFEYLDLMTEHDVALKTGSATRLPGRIRLMTAHKSKGLEFDYVIIMHAVAGKWGVRTRRESIKLPKAIYRVAAAASAAAGQSERDDEAEGESEDDADERNVFYVALTRARRGVLVTYSATNRDGRAQLPTPFITELPAGIFEQAAGIDDSEAALREHPETEFAATPEKKPELEDEIFVKKLFDEQGLSVTALNNYLECPWQYFYRNLVRIPEAPNKHLAFGNAVHAALRDYFAQLAAGDDRGKEYLVRRFEESLSHEPIPESDFEETLEKGRHALPGWFLEYHDAWNRNVMTERRIEGVLVGDVPVNGMIDKMELGKANAVAVVDYKTGEPKSRNVIEGKTAASNGNYKRQLVFYKLLLDEQGDYDMHSGTIDFIEPDSKGRWHREMFEIAPAEIVELRETIARIAAEIRSLAFWGKTCDREDCEYCALRRGLGSF